MAEKSGFRDTALRAVAIIGLIAILVLGAWGIIQLVVGLPDFFSSIGSSSNSTTPVNQLEQMTVTAPSITTATQPFTLSWKHQGGSGNYSYAISYSCADGLMIAAPVPTGQMQLVPCNTPFNFTNASSSVQLIPVLPNTAGQKQVTMSFTVAANRLSDGKITSTGTSTVVTVLPPRAAGQATSSNATSTSQTQTTTSSSKTSTPTTTTKPAQTGTNTAPSGTYTPSGHTTNLYGSPDLAVRILSVSPAAGNRVSVQFEISNVGTNVALYGWEFQAQLPLYPPYTYVSRPQQKMYPGDRIVYTMGFDAPTPYNNYSYSSYTNCNYSIGYNSVYGYTQYPNQGCVSGGMSTNNTTFAITADPQNLVSDYSRANNTATAQI